jgi:phosphate starvation-inducible PhoH-like protein
LNSPAVFETSLEPHSAHRLASLCGQFDQHLRQLEQRLDVQIRNRGHMFSVEGDQQNARTALQVLEDLYAQTDRKELLTPDEIHLHLQSSELEALGKDHPSALGVSIRTKKETIKPRGANQIEYVRRIREHDINFGLGPAGTGKTYLAVACAVEALIKDRVERILLVRPAVEAGEKLGFLPGDLAQKVDPYLRPLYDALYEMLGFETVGKMIERNVIEVAPLAYMRGRTLNHAFVILDESQNTTREQMKMFLTRIGFGSTAVITGDATQIDLPGNVRSGLLHAKRVLSKVDGISFTEFTSRDVVRHPIVQRIVEAYESSAAEDERRAKKDSDKKA